MNLINLVNANRIDTCEYVAGIMGYLHAVCVQGFIRYSIVDKKCIINKLAAGFIKRENASEVEIYDYVATKTT